MAIVFGQVLKGGIPVSSLQVRLCREFVDGPLSIFGVCGTGIKYQDGTDSYGFFIFSKVEPGAYEVLVILLPNSRIAYQRLTLDIQAGETQNLGSFDIDIP
jgi:hypothetical protein